MYILTDALTYGAYQTGDAIPLADEGATRGLTPARAKLMRQMGYVLTPDETASQYDPGADWVMPEDDAPKRRTRKKKEGADELDG